MYSPMNIGSVVEYIDQQKIICAVVLQVKQQRLRLLNQNNREVNLSASRLTHVSKNPMDMSGTRDFQVKALKRRATSRERLASTIDVQAMWELLHEEGDDIDVDTMTSFCFDPPLTSDNEAAVVRAFFNDKLYFKFGKGIFTPFTGKQVENRLKQIKEAEERERLIEHGGSWLRRIIKENAGSADDVDPQILTILQDYYVFEKESAHTSTAKSILSKAGADAPEQIFTAFVNTGIWNKDENIDLIRMEVSAGFPDEVTKQAEKIIATANDFQHDPQRRDLTHLPLITIDGQSTLDYDDAISLEKKEDGYIIGIHIIDVGYYIKDNDVIDRDARTRASSIYMPDDKISMLPPNLSEDMCSLREGQLRPGISTLVHLNRFFEIIDFEVVASSIKVHKQMTYTEANMLNGEDDPITTLHKAATVLREKRLKSGAVQITLPEVNVWIEENGEIGISRIDRENPSRMLVSELMILANSLMADFLAANDVPAVYRSQPEPKKRLFQGIETSLFPNCMQRKQLSRAIIGIKPENHSGLGVKAYVTATSPIRRYYDLITQRQIRSVLGYEPAYSRDQLREILQLVEVPMGNTGRVQFQRKRYWLFKYLESMKGSSCEAIVLDSRRDFYMVMLKEYMLEWKIPSSGLNLKPGDLIHVTIQHADARRDQLSLFV
ncbi:MAG: RNB domain-containing ribonuclease [Desulfobacteraceae bacterium]|nr:RNB domain-containing ribonuclease [Desulfobacteraceae bacterium]